VEEAELQMKNIVKRKDKIEMNQGLGKLFVLNSNTLYLLINY
jgi:hypothetical protein